MESSSVYSCTFSAKAQKEISVSWNWYEDRLQGLGDRFVKEVTNEIFKIQQRPKINSIRYKNYRQKTMETFPFLIIYRINERLKIIRIISVFHTSRNPKAKY